MAEPMPKPPGYEQDLVRVELPHRTLADFKDILDSFPGDFPTAWTYEVPSAMDMDRAVDRVAARQISSQGWKGECWIDLAQNPPAVILDSDLYADTPADELTEEAERLLNDWAANMRQTLRPTPPAGPTTDTP
jgi:hypothetical protein